MNYIIKVFSPRAPPTNQLCPCSISRSVTPPTGSGWEVHISAFLATLKCQRSQPIRNHGDCRISQQQQQQGGDWLNRQSADQSAAAAELISLAAASSPRLLSELLSSFIPSFPRSSLERLLLLLLLDQVGGANWSISGVNVTSNWFIVISVFVGAWPRTD